MASEGVKRTVHFERRIIQKRDADVKGWIEATLECGHLVQYCTPSVDFRTLHCGECVNAYLLAARETARAAQVGAVSLTEGKLAGVEADFARTMYDHGGDHD